VGARKEDRQSPAQNEEAVKDNAEAESTQPALTKGLGELSQVFGEGAADFTGEHFRKRRN
jgi:hypothetical protein